MSLSEVQPGSAISPTKRSLGTAPGVQVPSTLDPKPTYKKDTSFLRPSWSESFFTGLKRTGLGLGCVVCGALAIGLLPLTIIGTALFAVGGSKAAGRSVANDIEKGSSSLKQERTGQRNTVIGTALMVTGGIVAAPFFGLIGCIGGLKGTSLERNLADVKSTASLAMQNLSEVSHKKEKEKVRETATFPKFTKEIENLSRNELIALYKHIEAQPTTVDEPSRARLLEILKGRLTKTYK